jgi:hypothetical protein
MQEIKKIKMKIKKGYLRRLIPKTIQLPILPATVNHGLQSVMDPTYNSRQGFL